MTSSLEPLWREFRPGQTIYLPGASGESLALAKVLRDDPGPVAGVNILSCLVPGMNEAADYGSLAAQVTTFMLPSCMRGSFMQGRVSLIPNTYWGIARQLLATPCDVALAHVAPADEQGLCSLGKPKRSRPRWRFWSPMAPISRPASAARPALCGNICATIAILSCVQAWRMTG
jgi:hypothetical protein